MKFEDLVLDKELTKTQIDNFYSGISYLMSHLPEDVSVSDIENELGVGQGYIARTCNGNHTSKRMSIDNAIAISNIFEIPLDDLVYGDVTIVLRIEEMKRELEILKRMRYTIKDMRNKEV